MDKKNFVKFVVLFLILAVLFTWIHAQHEPFVVHAGHSRLNLKYDRSYQPLYARPDGQASTFDPRLSTPLSLASADFDADGTSDLAQGYAAGTTGVVALYRGNPDALQPLARNTNSHPYLNQAIIYEIPEAPDFLITGDFNQDGYPDILAASRGSRKAYLLAGDGSGAFDDPKTIDLPGSLTALAAAHFHTGDIGLDVLAAIHTTDGPALLYYESAQAGLGGSPVSFALPFDATILRTGLLDDDASLDIAIAGNGQLAIVHGTPQPVSASASASQLESINLPTPAGAIALGDFLPDRSNRTDIAMLSTDGSTLSILSRVTDSNLWQTARSLTLSSRVDLSTPSNVLTSGRFTNDAGEQVLVIDSTGRQIAMFAASGTAGIAPVLSVSADNTPVAAIAARTSAAARSGLAILQRGPVASFLNVPGDSVMVSTTDDVLDAPDLSSLAALIAHPGPDAKISLREAVLASNNGGGPNQIDIPAGTFTLTRRLDVLTSTAIAGAGSTTTIIQAGTSSANGVDKIFSFNPRGATEGIAVSISGLTLRYGKNAGGNGGAFDFDAGPDFGGSFSMDDVVLDQNGTTAGSGGAAAFSNGGAITIENSTISNNTAASDGNAAVFGGGLFFGAVPSEANGTISITNATVSGNSGGGLASLTIPMGVHNSRIAGNRNANAGGGVYGAMALDEATVVRNNTASSGGGIAGWGTLSGITIGNNSAEGSGGGILGIAGNQLTVNDSRIIGNTASLGKSAADVREGAAIQAVNNWWGSNDTPEDAVAASGVAFDPWLQMTFTASPEVVAPGRAATLTASIRTNSHNQAGFFVPKVANNTPVAFVFSGVDGASADPGTAATVSGTATSKLNAGSAAGDGTASATIDNQTLSKPIKIHAAATHLVVTAPAVATPNLPFTITVTAVDASNHTDTGYSGIVTFTSTDGAAILPANTALVNGTGTFSVTLATPGPQTITASDFNTPSITGTSGTIVVNQNVATHFQVISPNSATAGLPFSLLVTALDSANNIAKNYAGTVTFSSTDPHAVFPATATLTAGLGIFNVTLETAGAQTITVTDINTPSTTGTSGPTIVHAGPPSQFAIAAPATVVTGTPFTFTTTITDGFGNPASGYVGTLHFTSSDPNAVLPGDTTLNNGSGTFQATLTAIGIQTITARDTVIPAITGTASIRVLQLPAMHFSVVAPAVAVAGTPFNFTVNALDINNQPTSNYTGTVHFTSSDPLAILPANATLTNGVGTFSATLKTGGNQTITATDTVTPSINGTSNNINVIGGPAVSIVVTAPATATAGVPFNLTVSARDVFNNVAPGYSGTLHFTSTDPLAILPANAALTNGVGTFPATLKTVGSQRITAADIANASLSGTSNSIVVSIGLATHFSVTAPAAATAGQAFNFTVTALDVANNTVIGYTGTVHFTSTDPAAVLPANATLTNGTGTFSATLKTAGNQTITAADTVNPAITGTSNNIVVSAGTATTFSLSAPSTATAGISFGFTVTAKDAFGNTATGYAGSVHFTSSDVAAVLPPNASLTNGVGSFNATLMTDGSQTLTATDTVTPSITGTATITVGSGAAMHLVVSAPSTVTAGTPFSFTVTAKDGSNNTVTSYTGTLHFTSTDPAAVLPANATLTNGTGTFSATLKTTGTQTITATDSVTPSINGTSNPIQVTPGATTTLIVSAPASVTAGASFNFTVTAKDMSGNVVTGYNGTLHFTSTDPSAILPPDAMLVNGTGSFPATLKIAGTQTITAVDTVTPGINGTSNPIVVTAGPAILFTVLAPAIQTAGTPSPFTVIAKDANNNVVTGYNGTVHFTSTDAAALLPGDAMLTNGIGLFQATLKTTGTQTITATDTVSPSITGTSNPISVIAGSAMTLVVSAPATATAGTPFNFTVTAKDSSGNVVTGYTGTLHFTSTDSAASLPADATLVNGVGTFSATLKTAGTQTITATDTVTALAGTSNPILVTAGAAVRFVVSAPGTATASTPFNFTVTARDANNNTVMNYAGTVHFTSTDAASILPADATLTNGTGSFQATLNTSGTQTITATDTVTPAITGTSNPIVVGSGTAMTLVVSAPATATAGTPFTFTVTAKDTHGNVVTSYNGTLHFTSSDGAAVLPADTMLVNGTGTFTATLKTAGTQTITATDTATPAITGTSNPILVTAGTAVQFIVSAPSTATAGTPFNFTVTAKDANNNTVTNYAGTVHFTSTDAAAALPADATLTNGSGTFAATLKTAGTQTITATDTATPSITGTSNPIAVSAGVATQIVVSAPATVSAGSPFNFTVTAKDANGNTATGYTGTLHFTSTDAAAVLPSDTTLTNGVGAFQATLKTTGTQTITATDTATPSINGTSNPIVVTAGAPMHLVVSAPSSVTAGVPFNFTVTAEDTNGNVVPSYAGTLHFTSTDPAAVLPANATLTNGVGSFQATLKTAGTQTITATDTATPAINGTSNPIQVSAASATHLSVSAPSTATAGVPFNFTVTALDAFNNTATSYSGTLHFTGTDPAAILPANATLTNGVGSFQATLKTAGNQTITATDTATPSITGTSNPISVSASSATTLVVSAPSAVIAGAAFNFTVTAKDAFNNTATSYTGTLHFTSTDPAAVLPASTALTNGVGSFSATLKTTGIQTITATDIAAPSITGTSGPITVTAGLAMSLVVTAPATATAGVPFNFTVTAKDTNGNIVTGYTGTLHFTSSDGAAVLPADSMLTNGVGTFPATLKTAGPQTITATDVALAALTATSNTIQVSAGTATHLSVTAPSSVTAGAAFSFTVTARDAFNNTATSYTGTLHFTSTDAAAVLPADMALTNGVGSFSATLKTTGTQTITATDTVTPSITGTSGPITVNSGAAMTLVVTAPSTAVAGVPFNFTVTAKDNNGNIVTGYTGTLHFTSSDPAGILPPDAMLTNGVGSFPATLKTAGPQTITATDVAVPALTATSNTIQVSAGTATHLSVTAPSSVTAGAAFSFTVTALDAFNNTATGYTGTLHFTSTDAAAVLPPDMTLTNGVGSFSATLKTTGTQTITATDTVTPSITGTSGPITVNPGLATSLVVTAPASVTAGAQFNFTVTAKDANGNVVTGYTGTLHFTSSDAAGVLPANSMLTNGVGTFPATLKTAGSQTITATDVAVPAITATSNTIQVIAGTATHLSLTAPSTATAGTAFNFTVTALDAFNNTAIGYTGTLHFTSTDSAAVLPANATLTNGVGTFPATLKTSGTQTITATDTVTPAITGTSNPILVGGGAGTHFSVTAPATATAGVAFNFTVTALDANNNTATGYSGTVHFSSTDAAAVLPGNATLTNGVGTFPATLKTSGTQTITATDTVTPAITGTSNPILVGGGAGTHFSVTAPATATAGVAFNFTVTALDANNNTATGYSGTVHFSSTDAAAVLPGNATLTNGVGTFPATLKTSGTQTITATDTVTPAITGTSNPIVVGGGAGTHFTVTAPATATAGVAFNFTVTALDANNNTATGYSGTVHFSSTDAAAVLPGNATLTNGVGTFPATLKTSGTQTITATDAVTPAITGTSNPIVVGGGAGTHFSVTAPATATAGVAFNFTVTALDANNNTATSYSGTVHFTSTDSTAVLPVNATLTNGVGTFPATLKTSGTQTITATDTVTPAITGTSNPILVGGGAGTHFSVTAPATATAGVAFNFTVTALDANNNTATGYSGTVHFSSTDAAAVLPGNATLTNGVGTFPATLKTSGTQTITATDTVTPAITGTSNPILVGGGAGTHFSVTAPATATAGVAFNFTVTALDANNNTATGYSGTVHFSSTDAAAVLPGNATLTNGVGTFPATLKTSGTQTITATDTVTPAITGTSNPIVVGGGAGTHFTVTAPATATAGVAFNFTVTALDANNNTATSYSGTVHFSSTDAAAVLPGNATLTNGSGTFPATLKTTGNQTITAADTANPAITGTSNPIAVTSGNATHFTVVAPAAVTAGSAFNFTVTALDQFNNIATTYTGTVHSTSTDAAAILPPNTVLAAGTGTFPATLKTVGTQTISATDAANASITGTSNPITVSAGTTTHFSVTAPVAATGSVPFTFTVAALDQFNNPVPSYSGTVHFSSTDPLAVLPGNSVVMNGTGTFQSTLKTGGNQTITATDVAAPSITGTSNPIAVTILPATHFVLTGPSATMAGIPISVTLTALDSNNNPVLNYAGTVHFSSTDALASLPANSTLTNGTGTFPVTLRTPGLQMVTATDVSTPTLTASLSVSVSAGTATHFVVVAPATANSGTSFNLTVTALDQVNNVATGYTGTVRFTSTDASAVLPPNTSLVNGVATVPATLITGGNQTITATDTVNPGITGTSNPIAVGVGIVVQTSPAGRTFSVDGVTYTSAQTFFFQPGTMHTLLVSPTTQSGGTGTQYVFSSWNNVSTPLLQITAGTTGATYTANFSTQYLLTTSVSPLSSGTITPVSGFYNAGTTVPLTATPAAGFMFVNWSGPVTVTGPGTATVVVNAPTTVVAFFGPSGPSLLPVLVPDPTALFVTYYRGTSPITTTRSINLVSTNGDTLYSVSSSLPWITVTPSPGFTPQVVTVNFDFTGLNAGVYPGMLTVVTPYQSVPVPVTVTVIDFPMLVATPASLTIPIATPMSVAQSLDVLLSSTNRDLVFSLSTTASWLTVSSVNAQNMMTPARLHITADPSGMPNGTYTASVLVSAGSATNTPLSIPVTMVIGPQTQAIQVASFANGASFQTGPGAPNTIMSVFGSNFTCDTEAAVMVDGLPAEVLGATPNQINFVIPADDPNLNTAHVQVVCGVNVSPVQLISMSVTNPGVFTTAASGTGQGSILNQDVSLNGTTASASRGSIVSVFVTGFGQLAAPSADGLKRLVLPVTATIGGLPADITYAGAAPGYTSGLQQINIRVPDNAPVGASVPIVLTTGGVSTQTGVTIAVN